jgi:hypothetical protein
MGFRGIPSCDLNFNMCRVPVGNIVVPAGGFKKWMEAHMTRTSVKGNCWVYIVRLLGVGSRLARCMTRFDSSNLIQLTYGRHSGVAAPLSRLRRLRAQESETSLSGGAERQLPSRFA